VEEVNKRGLGMKMVFRAPGKESKVNSFNWAGKFSFGQELAPGDDEATTRAKVEKQVRRLTDDFKWNEDGSLELTQHIPGELSLCCWLRFSADDVCRPSKGALKWQTRMVQWTCRKTWHY
jgi:hypothetical protein